MMKNVNVVVKVLAVRNLYAYPCCTKCHRKLRRRLVGELVGDQEDRFHCLLCKQINDKSEVQYRYHVKLTVADGSGIAYVTVFGKSLEAFFGLTATEFTRYVSKYNNDGVNVDQIIHLSMEKCLLGSMVHLVFQISVPFQRNSRRAVESPVVLRNFVFPNMIPNSRKVGFLGNGYRKCPELLANSMSKLNNDNYRKTIVNTFTEYIKFYKKESLLSIDDKRMHLNEKAKCCGKHASHCHDVSLEGSCCEGKVDVVKSPWFGMQYHSGNDLVLSMASVDHECSNFDASTYNLFGEEQYPDTCTEVSDPSNKPNDEINLPNSWRVVNLSYLQQSLVYGNSNVPQICTSVTVEGVENTESICLNIDNVSTNPNTVKSICSETIHRSCNSTYLTTDKSDDESMSDVSLHSLKKCNPNVKTSATIQSYLHSTVSHFDFNVDGIFDSPSLADVDSFLAQLNLPWSSSTSDDKKVNNEYEESICQEYQETNKNKNDLKNIKRKTENQFSLNNQISDSGPGYNSNNNNNKRHCPNSIFGSNQFAINKGEYVGTPELFSPENISLHDHQPCLSSTPISGFIENCHSSFSKNNHGGGARKYKLNACLCPHSRSSLKRQRVADDPLVEPLVLFKNEVKQPLKKLFVQNPNDGNSCLTPVSSQFTSRNLDSDEHPCKYKSNSAIEHINNIELDDTDNNCGVNENLTYCCSPLLFSQI